MKRTVNMLMLTVATLATTAQPLSVRQQQTAVSMSMEDADIEWQRDVYREVSLNEYENMGLFCPQEPTPQQQGLFTVLLDAAASQLVPVYKYNIEGNEVFSENTRMDVRDMLRNHYISFKEKDGLVTVERKDMPASEVMIYYIKESVYYDRRNSAFRTRVVAICPVIVEEDGFTAETLRYPLFWMEYKDIEPFLRKVPVIADYRNRAAVMPMTDYFTLNRYKGSVYKVGNALGRTLVQEAGGDSLLMQKRAAVEKELEEVRKPIYNIYYGQEKPAEPTKRKFRWPWQRKSNNKE